MTGTLDIERLVRAEFERALPAIVRGISTALGASNETPRPLTDRDRERARTALRRLGLLPTARGAVPR